MRKVCDNFDQRICQKDHLDIMRHGNGCSSVEQHLENLKVVPDGVDDDDALMMIMVMMLVVSIIPAHLVER